MKDEIFYCSDINQLEQELLDNGMVDGEGNYTHGNTLTPIKYNGVKTLALVRDNKLDLALFPSIKNLLGYDELFTQEDENDEYAEVPVDSTLGLYRSVHPYHIPVMYIDDDGIEQSYYLHKKIGVFA